MAIPIINDWARYFSDPHEGLGSSYERIVINDVLLDVASRHGVKTALESPSFGFTGLSGINLLGLADAGVNVTLEDDDPGRLELVSALWARLGRPLTAVLNPDFLRLNHADSAFDLSFSFSALWFTPALKPWLEELSRVTAKVIFISVPNRDGLGYRMQVKDYDPATYPQLRLANIDPPSITAILKGLGWELAASDYFDCPPWPDIGMTKEDLLRNWFPRSRLLTRPAKAKVDAGKRVTILDLYEGRDPGFARRMRRYNWLERFAPRCFKRIWAHHYYLVFTRPGS